jgi:hypothetical protein
MDEQLNHCDRRIAEFEERIEQVSTAASVSQDREALLWLLCVTLADWRKRRQALLDESRPREDKRRAS